MNSREWPLVLFTLTGQAAAGMAFFFVLPLYTPAARAAAPSFRALRAGATLGVLLLAVAAIFLSLGHLGRIGRAPQAIRNLGKSWLSREIAALILFIAAAAVLALGEWSGAGAAFRASLAQFTTLAGGIFVFAMARLYMLPTIPQWKTAATPVAFFASAAVLGATLASVVVRTGYPGLRTSLPRIALTVMVIVYFLTFAYAPGRGLLARKKPSPAALPDPRLPAIFAVRMILFALAIFIWTISLFKPGAAGLASWTALALLLLSEVLGRFLFYSIPQGL